MAQRLAVAGNRRPAAIHAGHTFSGTIGEGLERVREVWGEYWSTEGNWIREDGKRGEKREVDRI